MQQQTSPIGTKGASHPKSKLKTYMHVADS